MSSRAEARARKKHRNAIKAGLPDLAPTETGRKAEAAPASKTGAVRPTKERMMQGKWARPQGPDKRSQPMVDLASDMIGQLYQSKQINTAQEQAARTFQELWAAYRSEIGAAEYRSCLAGGVGAHDDSDGNPAVCAAWNSLCNRIGRVSVAAIKMNVERQAGERPINLDALKSALDRVAEG